MISFIVPAHNEEREIARALEALRSAAAEVGEPFEIVVVNDASTDRTAELATALGARVIDVDNRQIAATRNAGVRQSTGEMLFFLDADTQANAAAIRAGLTAMRAGAVGGGCMPRFESPIPLWARVLSPICISAGRRLKIVGGCFLFCRREAFEAIGGFCEDYFAGEDVVFGKMLKRQGRFVIPRETVLTSNRKAWTMSLGGTLALLWRFAVSGVESFRSREGCDAWYGPGARAKGS